MSMQEQIMIKTRFTIAEAADLLKISEQDVIDLAAQNLPVCFHWRGTLAMYKRGQSLPVDLYWFDGYLRSRTPVKKNVATHHMKARLINGKNVIDEFTTYENLLIPSTVEIVQSLSPVQMPPQLSDDYFLTMLDENGNQPTGTSAIIPPNQWYFEIGDLGISSTGHEPSGISGEPEDLKSAATTHRINGRSNILSAVIDKAKESAVEANDPHSHWAAFVALAESPSRPSPLLGYSDDEGVKYQSEAGVEFLNKNSFVRRVRRRMKDH